MYQEKDVFHFAAELKARSEAFCLATVVRTVSVTAAKAGAKAVISADGTISEGWIGGGCARAAVVKAARQALSDGRPRLVSIQPQELLEAQGVSPGDERDGQRFARNMCPSQGTMDIFIEPMLPRPVLLVCGASPVAVALADLAPRFGFAVTVRAAPEDVGAFPAAAIFVADAGLPEAPTRGGFAVVATQGRGDLAALKAALGTDARHVAFVGSRRKIAALKTQLRDEGFDDAAFARLKAPAGLDIGAITPDEIALSILAEIVALRRRSERHAVTPGE